MTEPIDINELRRKLDEALEDGFPFARDWAERNGPRLLDALAALRVAAEPMFRNAKQGDQQFWGDLLALNDACRLVKLPEGAGK